ncbi:LacI family DNA-binding transcriptional regulator [Arthrobacter dokdonensis]|uniref:LacI family DNA-binding transcriptional regulator n=1 Tax=Arthrobacter dokdonellae TaxID=2211210 RepID=UPI000DE5A704|nr:LacI family DNA-binding transcriptional regulator [Arthrobacter dokdonellae]
MAGAVTVRDVARVANVSPATVSRVLTTPHIVAPLTRQRVLEAVDHMGYRPVGSAGVGKVRTGYLGLVVPDLENPYFASVTKGVQARALARGFFALVADSDEDPHAERDLVEQLSTQVDGLILCSARMSDEDLLACAEGSSTVLVNRRLTGVPSLHVDDAQIIRQALEHLYALGHRHVAYAGGPTGSWSDRQRREGIETVLADLAGMTVSSLGAFAPVFGGGQSAADLAVASHATAVLAYNDLIALGVLSRLRSRGIDVPTQMSVIGIDDISAASLVSPALTTVRAPLRRVGRVAVNLLLDVIAAGEGYRPPEEIQVQLVVRESTTVPSS